MCRLIHPGYSGRLLIFSVCVLQFVLCVLFSVNFKDLHKIKLPVGVVEGFDLALFDDARGIVCCAIPLAPPPPNHQFMI